MPGPGRDVAVIDVGSNSVRLVLYRVDGRAIWTTYNEKVLAGLGRDLSHTGRLSEAGSEQALAALRRFSALVEAGSAEQVLTAATAAVRDAQDGAAFVKRVRKETGIELRVLSGVEEAHASALGVAAGQADADGVVGDLGGSSLELIRLSGRTPGEGVTLPLGPLALGSGGKGESFDPKRLRREIAERLAPAAAAYRTDRFHAVGGAWRNIALLHMTANGWPLQIVHQYEMSAADALETGALVARQSKASLERIEGVSKKRAETLPYAALVLEGVIQALGVRRVSFSAYGLREGLIFDGMDEATRGCDPLVEGCASLGGRQGLTPGLGPALERWLQPLREARPSVFGRLRGGTLLAAAARLADIGAGLHPDHRATLAFQQVLRAPIAGQTHPERAYLAQAVFSRYSATGGPEGALLSRVLSDEALGEAKALGAALRLGCDLSGRSPALLGAAELTLKGDVLTLSADPSHAGLLLGEQTRKRLLALAETLGVKAEVV